MKVDVDTCLHCGACVGSCPVNAIYLDDTRILFDEKCTKCGRCRKACPPGAVGWDDE